jgi:tRNA pseudouridine38-40 synthase
MILRYFIELAYNGTDYFGWQRQPRQLSVQEVIESNLSKLYSNAPIQVIGCGRTDTGVHANHYILHVDLEEIVDLNHFLFKLNRMLPESIVFHSIHQVDKNKHARFDAISRTYRYFIHKTKNPFVHQYSWYIPQPLDINKMNAASQLLIGKQDFTSLAKLHSDVKTNICEVASAEWIQASENKIYFEIRADRFLRNMVRATVGTLVDVGLGKLSIDDFETILKAQNRQEASTSAPAFGLFLWKVKYE